MKFNPAGKEIKGPGGGKEIKGRATIYTPANQSLGATDDVKASGTVWPWRFDNADADEGATSDDFANTDVAAKTSLWDPTEPTSSHMYSLMYCVSSCFLVNFFCLSLLGVFTVCCDATSAGL